MPLTKVFMKNQGFVAGEAQQWCFDEHKRRLMPAPLPANLDPNRPIEIHTDASAVGRGAVVIQQDEDGEHLDACTNKVPKKLRKVMEQLSWNSFLW